MLALILAVNMTICPHCGNYDALALYNGEVVQVHAVEDAAPGDVYSICTGCDDLHPVAYIGYIY